MAEKLFPVSDHRGPWTANEVLALKRYLGATSEEVIARVLRRDVKDVREQILELGRIRQEGDWSRDEIAELKRIYGTRTEKDLAVIFGRPESEVEAMAKRFALAKDKAFVRKLSGESSTRMPRWTAAELEILKRDYPSRSNLEIAQELDRSVKSVVSKAHNLGLKKSTERLRSMGRENVSLRYKK